LDHDSYCLDIDQMIWDLLVVEL